MWHRAVPLLKDFFSLVIPDSRGYGNSIGPKPDAAHINYSKRTMAVDMIALMSSLGHKQFYLAGHDRGARVAYRLALDHPQSVHRLAVLDILPTLNVWEQINEKTAMANYHWLLLSQPSPLPEHLIGCDPDFFLNHILGRWAGHKEALSPAAMAEYLRHFRKSSVIEAACEDYRAGASVDLEHDRLDRAAGHQIRCPTYIIWSKRFLSANPLKIWQQWAEDVRELILDCGHFVAEEDPISCATALRNFFLNP
ncbi:MAG TPA: alpha/beta fold hydrolase [Verrucomicrobiae bacterium]|jgi:haloacetate dehalogenase